MSVLLLKGFLLGLTLSFMVGPLLFAIVETSLVRGLRAGLAVAAGMWASDLIFIGLAVFGTGFFEAVVGWPHFRFWAGVLGGAMLCFFGLCAIFPKGKNRKTGPENPPGETFGEKILDMLDGPEAPGEASNWSRWGLFGLWFKGFVLNSLNPGTIFFWLGIVTALVLPSRWAHSQTAVFFGGMMATLIVTDSLKAWGAKSLRRFLTPAHIFRAQRGIGFLLLAFGLALVFRAF